MIAPDAFQPKLIYLTKRNPLLSPAGFTARWRQHGTLGMSLPRWRNIARYVHCDVFRIADPPPELDTSYDGVGLIWHRSLQARAAHLQDTTSRTTMERDETETFAAPIATCCLLARETVYLKPHSVGKTRKVIVFHRFPSKADYVQPVAGCHESLYRALASVGAQVQGHVINTPIAPERDRWGLEVDQIQEWWFQDMAAGLRGAPLLNASCTGIRRLVLTNEVVLHGC